MILVGQYDSPYVRRCAVALHLLDLPFARDTRSAFADADAMRRINPLGRIPSLILDDGEVVIDSAAILDHLDQRVGPSRALLPPTGGERRVALFASVLATGTIDKLGGYIYERTLRPADKQYAPWIERCNFLRDRARELFPEPTYPRLARLADRCLALPAFVATTPSAAEAMPGLLR